jgi:hypothetical protein
MRRAFITTGAALCACSLLAADASGASSPTNLLPTASPNNAVAVIAPASAGEGGVVAQAATAEQVTVSAYTRSVFACISRSTGRHRIERRVDRIVSTVVTSGASAQTVRLPTPRVSAPLTCRSSEIRRRVRLSYTDITARSATGEAELLDASFLNNQV